MLKLLVLMSLTISASALPGEAFSGESQWEEMVAAAANFDITPASGTTLSMSTGGTSVYGVINRGGRAIGAVIPQNSATQLSGEVMSYTVARLLAISELYQAGIYVKLTGRNLEAFGELIPEGPFKNSLREKNRQALLKRIAKNPDGIDAIFKKWEVKPAAYDSLVSGNRLNSSHVLKGSSKPFASFLKCDGPQPSKEVKVIMNGGQTSELEAARQMSSILLIDALMQQWDRFSGGNLQTAIGPKGQVHFAAFDNGGTWSEPWTAKNLSLVTRFDREVARRLLELNRFLNLGGSSYLGIRTEKELIKMLNAENFPSDYARFKKSLAVVARHLETHKGCKFE